MFPITTTSSFLVPDIQDFDPNCFVAIVVMIVLAIILTLLMEWLAVRRK